MNTPPMLNQNLPPLEQLRDFQTPEAVPPSPADAHTVAEFFQLFWQNLSQAPQELAPAWWLLLACLLTLLGLLGFWIRTKRRKSRYRRLALKELKALYKVCDSDEFLRASARLIKRVVIHHIDASAANQYGEQWQQHIVQLHPQIPETAAFALAQGQYQQGFAIEKQTLNNALERWLRRHRA